MDETYYVEPEFGAVSRHNRADPVLVAGGVPVSQQVRGRCGLVVAGAQCSRTRRSLHGTEAHRVRPWPGVLVSPMERGKVDTHNNLDLQNNDCDARQLTWREWSGDETSAARRRYRRRYLRRDRVLLRGDLVGADACGGLRGSRASLLIAKPGRRRFRWQLNRLLRQRTP